MIAPTSEVKGRLLLLGLALLPARLLAEPPRAALDYAPLEGCPDQGALTRAVAARLGRDPFDETDPRVLEVHLRRTPSAIVAEIALREPDGSTRSRRLEAAPGACAELLESAALAISVAIDPLSVLGSSPAETSSAAPARPVEPPPPPLRTPPEAPPPPATHFLASLRLLGVLGAEPAPALGFAAALSFGTPGLRIGVEARVDLPAALELGGRSQVSAQVVALGVAGCLAREGFALCTLGELGALLASGDALDNARGTASPWGGVGGRIAYQLPLPGPIGLEVHLDVLVVLARTNLFVGAEAVWTSPAVTAALGLGPTFRFQ